MTFIRYHGRSSCPAIMFRHHHRTVGSSIKSSLIPVRFPHNPVLFVFIEVTNHRSYFTCDGRPFIIIYLFKTRLKATQCYYYETHGIWLKLTHVELSRFLHLRGYDAQRIILSKLTSYVTCNANSSKTRSISRGPGGNLADFGLAKDMHMDFLGFP